MKKYLIKKLYSDIKYYPNTNLKVLIVILSFIPLWLFTKVRNCKINNEIEFDDSDDLKVLFMGHLIIFFIYNIISLIISAFIKFSLFTLILPILLVFITGKMAQFAHKLNNSKPKWN